MSDQQPKTVYFSLQPSEMAIFRASAEIYAGYVAAGQVTPQNTTEFQARAIREAIRIARLVEQTVISDNETDSR